MRLNRTLPILAVALTMAAARAQEAKPFLSPMFTDNMVLQRGIKTPIWGWANPGDAVSVAVQGKTAKAKAGPDGKWLAKVGPLTAGGPVEVSVAGPQAVVLHNVLVGDVWICSGQSNMEMGILNLTNAEQEVANATDSDLRLFTVPHKVSTEPQEVVVGGPWEVCSPETIRHGTWGGFSAAAYFFGRELRRAVGVPIGLVHTSWGGTPAESWTSGPTLAKKLPEFAPAVANVATLNEQRLHPGPSFADRVAAWWKENDPGSKASPGWQDPATDTSTWKTMALPGAWETKGYADFDGVMWFRRTVTVPDTLLDKAATLHLGPIDDWDTTWVNGVEVGGKQSYDAQRDYKLPDGLLKPGENTIVVRVLDGQGDGGFTGRPSDMRLDVEGLPSIPLFGDWQYRIGVAMKDAKPLPQSLDDSPYLVSSLYNGMIAPVLPYGIKGAIWYQGEANADRAYQYRTLLPVMINDWRSHWNQGAFPFFIVQLANFMKTQPEPADSQWAELREAQTMTAAHTPKTGIAMAIDIGDANDIHPKNKQEVGRRLGLSAERIAYGMDVPDSGPVYRGLKIDGGKAIISFTKTDGGLTAKGDKLTGFQIAGADRKWFWADAEIAGNTVAVSSPSVPQPVAVRYAWADNPVCNLYNGAGLPAGPFRTDDWPGITAPK
ncbi:MAG TPA: sialate O-acetylesterase [Armatimonadota bacterium]|jgi:sialate O-acetylesterase